MVSAAAGYLPPAHGALLQEGIDVAVILNALRAVSGGRLAGADQENGLPGLRINDSATLPKKIRCTPPAP